MSNREKDIFLLSIAMPIYVTILLNGNVFIQRQLHPKIKVFCFEQVKIKGWLPIAKLKPLVERYSCHPMRSLDTSNNLSVGPSCM